MKYRIKQLITKHRFTVAVIMIFLIIAVWIKSICYIMENRDKIVFTYLMYDHVEYNGNAYYMAKNQHLSFPASKKGSPVYLVYKENKIYFEPCHDAIVFTGYEGDEKELYIFFDSAIYIREDYQYLEQHSYHFREKK